MLTFRTHVIEPGSWQDKFDKFWNKLIHPYKWNWMINLARKKQELREQCYIGPNISKDISDISKLPVIDKGDLNKITMIKDESSKKLNISFRLNGTDYHAYEDGVANAFVIRDGEKYRRHIYTPELGWYDMEYKIKHNHLSSLWNIYYMSPKIVRSRMCWLKYKICEKTYKFFECLSLYKLLHTVDSIILCLRFPFLYPRNRFTDKHYNNYTILERIKKYDSEAYLNLTVHFLKDEKYRTPIKMNENTVYTSKEPDTENETTFITTLDGRELILCQKSVKYKKPSYTYNAIKKEDGIYYVFDCKNDNWISLENVFEEGSDDFDAEENKDKEYIFHFYRILVNKNKLVYKKLWSFLHHILEIIFCIPTYTELDALDEGWRRNFGIQLCKDVKEQLIKDKMLYSFRISQIKEKFGGLRFYFAGGSHEMYALIQKYEDISYKTCISCGRPAKYMTRGWISPYCELCINDPSQANEIK